MLRIGLLKDRRIKIIEILIKLGGRIVRVVVYYNILALPKLKNFIYVMRA
jgi:hypothetical protein